MMLNCYNLGDLYRRDGLNVAGLSQKGNVAGLNEPDDSTIDSTIHSDDCDAALYLSPKAL